MAYDSVPEFLQERAFNCVTNGLDKVWNKHVKNRLDYVWNYEKKAKVLGKEVKKLQDEGKRVRDKAEEDECRYGSEVHHVKVWLAQVDEIISAYEKLKEEHGKHAGCPLPFPNPKQRYCGSKRAEEIKEMVGELQKEKQDNISCWEGPPSMGVALSNVDYEDFESRRKIMEKIMEALGDSSARMIGVHGLAGVGKTTLVIEAARKAQESKLFDAVIMVNVTKSPDIRKILGQIADILGMKLEEESEHARAVSIQERLKKDTENILIILDDLCTKVDLNVLGIPSQSGDGSQKNLHWTEGKSSAHNKMESKQIPELEDEMPKLDVMKRETTFGGPSELKAEERYRGYKILLISELRQVLSEMDVKARLIFSVNVLNVKEAEILFKNMAGIGDKNSELETLAAEIAKRCHGLPMSIVTIARALKNQSHSVWQDAHRRLERIERQNLTGAPEYSTKLSYGLLENEELKLTFLLCARMDHDALVANLVKYCIGLGFLQGVYTVREARNRVQMILVKLKESGLLSNSYSSDHFTMQNLVRNAALSIASEENFTMIEGKLDEWPDEDNLKSYTAISLHNCDVIKEFPKSIKCPRLRVFHVDSNDPYLKVPDNFFQEMQELRVLILTNIHLSPLPSSISRLTKLRMLCLEQCTLEEQLCIIGELKNLRILSFSGSDIESLPVELERLSMLQIFDVSNCSKLKFIPPNVISSLTSLEELYMRNVLIQWRVDERQESQSKNASLSELGHLNRLTNLDLQIPSAAHWPKNLFFDKLYTYKIVIGSSNRYLVPDFKMLEKYELSRFLAIAQKDGFDIHSRKEIKILFERVENLLLEKLNGVQDLFYELNLKGFPYLKHLSIVSNSNIQCLINPKDRKHPEKAFPKLESLHLYKLKNIKEICSFSCRLSAPSFGKLKIIKIKLCGQLKNVFLISTARLLTVLETIEVSECNSLKEIVHVENANEIDFLKFPELRSLTLQSLSEFIGFDPISAEGHTQILFHKKDVLFKLERLKLSAIQIDQIWIDQSSHFENLMHLDVNGCWNLKYLLSLSAARNLVNLQSLFVSKCDKMRHIFREGQDIHAKRKGNIFPNLKNIKLSSMKSLREICNYELSVDSFGKLDTLIIDECDKLVKVFSRYMMGIFRRLSSLRVTNCKSVKAILDLANKKRDSRYATNLQDVHLETLPKLEHVLIWKKDRRGILKLKNLQKIWVGDCGRLENIFPVSVANTLENLECLVVWDCARSREIVAEGEDAKNNSSNPITLAFPKLTTIKILGLPNLKSFYPGDYKLSCPALNDLSVEFCDKLEPFREEATDAQRKPILFPVEVINKLKSMQIELQHAKSSTNYRRDNLEELHLSKLKNTDILYSFLHHNPNLKRLWLNNCFFEELVPLGKHAKIERLGVVPKLKSLKLTDLPHLKNIGFERDAILQRIESLILKNCPGLHTIVPSWICLAHLTYLKVVDCKELKYLMPLSTAKSLGQLSTMKLSNCASLTEIVSGQGMKEEENAGKVVVVVFKQLKALELVSMKNLKSFCSSKSCAFEFPSLEKFVVSACPKVENFSQEVKSAPILQEIYVVHDKENKRWYWKGNLQDTIKYMFEHKKYFEGMDELNVCDHLDLLEQVWRGKERLQKDWFYSLKILKLENCEFEPYAIPSNVLRRLKCLKELEDEQGIPSFHNLQEVAVTACEKLETLFPVALAKKLEKLEEIYVSVCSNLPEIVDKQAVAAEGTEKFVFPRLTVVALYHLPRLTHFYAERFSLECPELNYLKVRKCNELELFQSQQEAHPEGEASTSINEQNKQPFFSDIKVISTVETLFLDWKHTSVLRSWLGQSPDQDLRSLNELNLFDDDENENSTLHFEILEKTPNLEEMTIGYSRSLKEISFPSQNSEIGKGMLPKLKQLSLLSLYKLHSISGLEHSSKLRLLDVSSCDCLTTLAGQSCSNLKELRIDWCDGLQCLFTSSAAKMLIHLEEMSVKNCELMKEIIGNEQDETATDAEEMKFERLERIHLESLESLEYFYSGNATLKFPSLIQVDIVDCSKMKNFSEGSIHVESSGGIRVSYGPDDDLVFPHDLNAAVALSHLQMERLVLADYPELKGIWLGIVPIPDDWSSCKWKYLEVEGCEFLSNAILPSHLLPLLSNLEELVVRKCDCVEAILDVKDTTTHDPNMIIISLKTLTLEQLPALRHVWNKDPKGSLDLPFLEEVTVNECKSIKSLFPASVPKDKLTKLDVRNCVELVEIVAKDEAATETANKEVIMFPRLTSLTLWDLPNLRCICCGIQILDWPVLKDLDVYHCQMLKIFATDFQDSPDSYPEGGDHITTDQHGFVSAEKVVTPYLERLSLSKEDIIMIEKGLLHVNFQKVKFLRLQSFNEDSDAFPDIFFSKVPLPSIQKFGVIDSAFKEIFHSQRPDIDYTKILSQLYELELRNLHKLKSIRLEHTWMAPLLENLQVLKVLACSCFTNLAPSTMSFSNLIMLEVEDCAGLESLFTFSTAKSLVALEKMSISNCKSLEIVVAHEEGDKPDEDVIFTKLTTLSLSKLPKLGSFYARKSTLNFQCLEDISITQCERLEYLFISSTAKSLVALKKMSITNCESLETVVAHEEGDKPDEHVTFPELWELTLSELTNLRSFYTGKSTLNFPWLDDVSITQCKRMTTFSHGKVLAPALRLASMDGVNLPKDDLNNAICQQFENRSSPELA